MTSSGQRAQDGHVRGAGGAGGGPAGRPVPASGQRRGMAAKRRHLAARRRALGFTQESLAERLGVHPTTVKRWENGGIDNGPHPWIRRMLAEHLQVSAEELEGLLTECDSPAGGALAPARPEDHPAPGQDGVADSAVLSWLAADDEDD